MKHLKISVPLSGIDWERFAALLQHYAVAFPNLEQLEVDMYSSNWVRSLCRFHLRFTTRFQCYKPYVIFVQQMTQTFASLQLVENLLRNYATTFKTAMRMSLRHTCYDKVDAM